MIKSIYEPVFEMLLRKQEVLIPEEEVNKESMRIQWIKFRDAQFGADWLIEKVLDCEYIASKRKYHVFLRTSKRKTYIPFTILETNPDAESPISTDLEQDQTRQGSPDT